MHDPHVDVGPAREFVDEFKVDNTPVNDYGHQVEYQAELKQQVESSKALLVLLDAPPSRELHRNEDRKEAANHAPVCKEYQ